MTLTRITTADMGDSYDCWAGSDPQAAALLAHSRATANPGLVEEFQARVRAAANTWLAEHARDTSAMSVEDEREVEWADYTAAMQSVDVEAIAAELLADPANA